MPPRIIVNGDDMGLSGSINESIALLMRQGLMSSASILVKRDAEAFRDATAKARALAAELPGVGFGLHLDLDRYFLFDEHGRYGAAEEDIVPWYRDIWSREEEAIVADMERQFATLPGAGIFPDHVDGHHNAHLFPPVLPEVLRLMERYSISGMRFSPSFYRSDATRGEALVLLRRRNVRVPDHFIDLSRIMAEGRGMLDALEGTVEIMAHTDTEDNAMGRVDQYRYLAEGNLGGYEAVSFRDRWAAD
ncbi:MAG: ChbG/HpnK family deacetylase [Spirochaetes bacterium]|nr:ChbG/HpnK family deacetylase [Spirochaetota bacterium]